MVLVMSVRFKILVSLGGKKKISVGYVDICIFMLIIEQMVLIMFNICYVAKKTFSEAIWKLEAGMKSLGKKKTLEGCCWIT